MHNSDRELIYYHAEVINEILCYISQDSISIACNTDSEERRKKKKTTNMGMIDQ